jgi:ketosteroid isomerase-like protein
MRTSVALPLFALALTATIAAADTSAPAKPSDAAMSTDEAYIVQCERDWAASVATGDTSAVERCLADDFVGVNPKGEMYDKAMIVADTPNAPKHFASNHLNEVKVRFFGDTAIAPGHESWQRHDGEPLKGRFVWTDTWIKRHGKWQIVAAEDLIAPELKQKWLQQR